MHPKFKLTHITRHWPERAANSSDNDYIRDNLQEARWFIKSLLSRNETLMKVATKIVEYQRGFLEYGEEAMKPLVLHDIAEAVGMHESTISRVTTQKYMHTPRGIFELKFFFSSHVSTDTGGECSSTAIRALIKKLVAAENPRKPLSDSKITVLTRRARHSGCPPHHCKISRITGYSALKRAETTGIVAVPLLRSLSSYTRREALVIFSDEGAKYADYC